MAKVIITESKMRFGEYEEENVFEIEKSEQYTEKLRPNGIRSCEFVLRRENTLYFVEAKESCPRQITAETTDEKRKKYREYVDSITEKMRHSLMLYSNILLKRYSTNGVSELLQENDMSKLDIRLVLVVKNAEKAWLEPFNNVFNKELDGELKIWKIPSLSIINEETARRKGFIL